MFVFEVHLNPISKFESIYLFQGFLLRYITFSCVNWLKRYEPSKFEIQKKCLNYDDLCSKMHLFQTLFWTPNFDGSPFLGQLRQERVIYLKRKSYYPLFERSFEIGRIFAMGGSRPVLVEVVLFLVRSTRTRLEPSMAKILPVSKLLSNNG